MTERAINVKLDLDAIHVATYNDEPQTVLDCIIREAGTQLLNQLERDARDGLRRTVKDITAEVIRGRVTTLIDEALTEPLQRTNDYGEPIGPPTTLREQIMKIAREQLKPTGQRNSFATDKGIDTALKTVTASVVGRELADEVAAAKADLRGRLAASAAEALSAAIVKGMAK